MPERTLSDDAALETIAQWLRDPEWSSAMLEDIAQVVDMTGRDTEGDGTPTWSRH